MVAEITDSEFDTEVINADKDVLVDFYTPTCVPCSQVEKILKDIKKELGDTVKVVKINVCNSIDSAIKYSIMSVPTVMSFHNGRIKKCLVGSHKQSDYIAMIK